jgi:hypothetical protein
MTDPTGKALRAYFVDALSGGAEGPGAAGGIPRQREAGDDELRRCRDEVEARFRHDADEHA